LKHFDGLGMLYDAKAFGKNISDLFCRGHMLEMDEIRSMNFTDVVELRVDVLRLMTLRPS
jgi:hypothetical protein